MEVDMVSLFGDRINAAAGIVLACLSYLTGGHRFFFVFFIFLNFCDYVSRWIAARITGTESSQAGWIGILKKLGYWIMIAIAFGMSVAFVKIGNIIGIDLGITTLLGWFVLATLMTNEVRSILENLYEAGYKIPKVLIKGLAVANKALDEAIQLDEEEVEEILEEKSEE